MLAQPARGPASGWSGSSTPRSPRHHPIGPRHRPARHGGRPSLAKRPRAFAVVDRRLCQGRAGCHVGHCPPARCLRGHRGRAREAAAAARARSSSGWPSSGVERGTPLLAVGGGTIGDLVGTAAALYARGLPLVQVPTTWLAQADSAIGGKVAVDLGEAKNAVGAFWPPVAVFSDARGAAHPAGRLRRDGMAESHQVGAHRRSGALAPARGARRGCPARDEAARYAIIERSARLKLAVCGRDPFETGERRTLNLGHTIGHALEIESGYRLPHGAAVALGLRAVAAIAARAGRLIRSLPRAWMTLLGRLGFDLQRAFDAAVVRAAMRRRQEARGRTPALDPADGDRSGRRGRRRHRRRARDRALGAPSVA